MKSKILLGTLLGGALLAACTADDALDMKQVAGGMNPAAPVFTVSFTGEDGDMTRAIMGTGEITWEASDKMSLFHGGDNSGVQDFYGATKLARDFNAVYSGKEGAGSGSEFTTKSMVTPGAAIMIYPADLTYDKENDSKNPHITVPVDQLGGNVGERTRDFTPYIS